MKSHSPRINNRSPRWKRTVINSAVVMAVSSLCAPAVYAAACGADIISGQITPCTLTALEFTVISDVGSIAVPASGVAASITVDDLATGVSIDNSGTISNEAGFSAISVAASAVGTTITNQANGKISATSAAAIHFYGALDKRLKNEGAILSTGSTYAAGVVVDGNLNAGASITNTATGTITATAINTGIGGASAYGIFVGSLTAADATITNKGEITVSATASSGGAEAYGVKAGDLGDGVVIRNSNKIAVTASAKNASASVPAIAYGIAVGSLGAGASITNSGTIAAKSIMNVSGVLTPAVITGFGYPSATGISTGSLGAGASIVNSGTITATIEEIISGATEVIAVAAGISTGNLDAGANISNNDTITATGASTGPGKMKIFGIKARDLSGGATTIKNYSSINAIATAAAGTANAVGIYAASLGAGTSIVNSGTITASTKSTGVGSATAHGIEVGTLSGIAATATNSNTINATAIASAAGDVNAAGIYAGSQDAGASIANSGTITVIINAATTSTIDATATARGIEVAALSGSGTTLTNSNTIGVTATAAGAGNVYAAGIYAGSEGAGATIHNGGTITVNATTTSTGKAYARGVEAGTLSGAIMNDSTIVAVATTGAGGEAHAAGIYAVSLNGGTSMDGSGTITSSAISTSNGTAYARGIEAGVLSGAVTNNLAITATATANAAGDIYAAGIYAGSLGVASMGGRGIITAQASATGVGVATARGIEIASPLGAMTSMTNNLKINATATGTSGNADSYGVYAGSMSGGAAIINGSTIAAEAHVTDVGGVSTSSAYGMFADGMSDANTIMNNTNEIVVNATGTVAGLAGDRAFAYGMKTTSLNAGAVIANEGAITVSAGGAAGVASAFGIYVGTLNSTVRNSGTITATAPAATGDKAYSVFATSGSGEVINSGRMIGRVGLGGTVNMTNTGLLSIANTSGEDSSIGLNYTQSSAGVLRVGVTSASNRTQLIVANTARFDGVANLSVEVQQGATLDPTLNIEDVVSATTLATGIFNITDNNLAWQFTAVNDGANHIDLTPVNTGMTTLAAVAGSKNTAGVAAAIDAILASKPGGTSVESLYTLTSLGTAAEVATALQNFTPVLGGNAALSTVDVLRAGATNVVHEHLQDAGGLPSGDGMSDKAGWIKPFGSWAKQKDRNGELGYQADSFGLVAGRDRKISDQWSVGGALAYGKSKIDNSNGTHDVSIRTYQASAYATNHFNETNALNLQFDLGTNRNNSHRAVAGSVASADYDSRHVILNAELERAFKMGNKTMLTPTVGVQYINLKVGGYGESGSPPSLTVASQNQKALIISLGGTAAYKLDDEATLTAHLNFGRDIKAGQEQVTASFSNFGGSTFVTKDINPSANVIRMGVGYEIEKASGTSVVTRYDLDTKSSGYTNHMLSLNLKTLF